MSGQVRESLRFPASQAQQLDPYLPPDFTSTSTSQTESKPYVTLTFATSLDSQISLAPGVQTVLSGPASKAMTHYLRSKHDAILVGAGTAVADDPSLNCRIEGVGGYGAEGLSGQPRPIVIDPNGRWNVTPESKVVKLAGSQRGRGPWIVTGKESSTTEEKRKLLESVGGRVLKAPAATERSPISWANILQVLAKEGVKSVMIEGGGAIINDLLSPGNLELVDSIIVTIAPVWLGKGGVQVCPDERVEGVNRVPVGRLEDVRWVPLGDDVVLCGHPNKS
ncbi:dihydrofolate reductase-like domain-containing protein [Paraphoma chrysanthemicola]|nr:dihydrofolate reductase-like domain-containing protein [Paraphoma chrysanthemicola]